jgi:hypothetical protein
MAIGTASELDIRIHHLVDPNKCYDFFRAKKWSHGVCCPKCTSNRVKKNGRKRSDPLCQNYKCNKGSAKNNLAFLHPDFTISLTDLQSQNPRNSLLCLRFCSIRSTKSHPNPSVKSAKLFLREPYPVFRTLR